MKMKRRKILGCNLGLRKMVVVLVVLNMCWGEGVIPIPTYIYI